MSSETVTAFVERVRSDEAFRTKLADAEGPAERLALARAEGFDLHADDVGTIKTTLGIEELSEEDLERVAGGVGTTTVATVAGGSSVVVGAVAGEVAAAIV